MPDDLPYFPLYPSDWALETKSLTLFEKGALMELACSMHSPQKRGYLSFDGKPMPLERVARVLGTDKQTAHEVLSTLLESGVLEKETDSGVLFYPPMVKREKLRKIRQEVGRKGASVVHGIPFAMAKPEQTHQQNCGNGDGNGFASEGGGAGGRDFSVEPPEGFPKSPDEAWERTMDVVFQADGKPPRPVIKQFVTDAWLEVANAGWRDRRGNPIAADRWHGHVSLAWSRRCQWEDRNPVKSSALDRPKTITELRTIKEAKEKIARELENRWASPTATGAEWSDAQKKQMWRDLQKEIKDLNNQIANFK